jgi:hypothetical protein
MMNRYENRLDRQIKTTLDRLARLKLQPGRPTNVEPKEDNRDSGSQNVALVGQISDLPSPSEARRIE